jgi:hypothetical protein
MWVIEDTGYQTMSITLIEPCLASSITFVL